MPLLAAAVLFAIFTLNVALGSMGAERFLGDVGEMLVLFAAVIGFVVAILGKEAAEKNNSSGE
ncbi:hypothetical protein E2K80_12290 [Rhodophyticola sp. CCM32]|uniref:hypothetical protein n=1 Tax=Rhodophyticola sp. CCM32 TaxID=2916397 RepID=UPI00107F1273|nr:hypothetical protein [Rhodophyticola sp. CCM32]QBY01404.1 hypothetical protein E2K80_12290 [Rhodophyticola sp. CCM32]